MFQINDSSLRTCITLITQMFADQVDHTSVRAIEVQLDCLEFFLSTVPESLMENVGAVSMLLLSLSQRIKRKELRTKCIELL